MPRRCTPSGPVKGSFKVPGSKSLTNRALVCAALAEGKSVIENPSDSDDSALLCNALNQLGVLVEKKGGDWTVHGSGGRLVAPRFPIPVGNAGTTLRFLLSLSAVTQGKVVLEGSPRMGERPNDELILALRSAGVEATQWPAQSRFEVAGGGFHGGRLSLRQDRSSQFVSSLLLVAPYARNPVVLSTEGPAVSQPYIGMTLEVMRQFGVTVEVGQHSYSVPSTSRYMASRFRVEADASGASYGMAAAAITGGEVTIVGARLDSLQGDMRFASVLERMGCEITPLPEGLEVSRAGRLIGIDVDMGEMPDVVPTLAAVALFAEEPSRIKNVGHLRFKESDRLEGLETELRKLGASIVIEESGIMVVPSPLHGGELDSRGDHRLAMSFALVGLVVGGLSVTDPDCVRKSFPGFWQQLEGIIPGSEGGTEERKNYGR